MSYNALTVAWMSHVSFVWNVLKMAIIKVIDILLKQRVVAVVIVEMRRRGKKMDFVYSMMENFRSFRSNNGLLSNSRVSLMDLCIYTFIKR